jgi:hypothetical protein
MSHNARRPRSARAVDVSPMLDPQHDDLVSAVVDAVEDAERSSAGGPNAFELVPHLLAHSSRLVAARRAVRR